MEKWGKFSIHFYYQNLFFITKIKKKKLWSFQHFFMSYDANYALSFSDAGQMKIKAYESDTFMQEMETTWQGLKPLYEQVTKYKYL